MGTYGENNGWCARFHCWEPFQRNVLQIKDELTHTHTHMYVHMWFTEYHHKQHHRMSSFIHREGIRRTIIDEMKRTFLSLCVSNGSHTDALSLLMTVLTNCYRACRIVDWSIIVKDLVSLSLLFSSFHLFLFYLFCLCPTLPLTFFTHCPYKSVSHCTIFCIAHQADLERPAPGYWFTADHVLCQYCETMARFRSVSVEIPL